MSGLYLVLMAAIVVGVVSGASRGDIYQQTDTLQQGTSQSSKGSKRLIAQTNIIELLIGHNLR